MCRSSAGEWAPSSSREEADSIWTDAFKAGDNCRTTGAMGETEDDAAGQSKWSERAPVRIA